MNRIAKAIDQAQADRSTGWAEPSASGQRRSIRVAIGDPQASLERFFGVLDANRLLGDAGRLRPDVQRQEEPAPILKAEFERRFPDVPTEEVVARDLLQLLRAR